VSDVPADPQPVRVLVVEDAPVFQELARAALEREGFAVDVAADGETALELARDLEPPLIVLDLNLPGIDGLEVCRRLRQFSDAYVVMVTGRDEEIDKLVGLTVGADDYITKPFSGPELVARMRAMLRRPRDTGPDEATTRMTGELEIDAAARTVRLRGVEVDLTRIEFDLLELLTANPRVVLSRGQILDQVWGRDWFGDHHVVDVHLSKLRAKLGEDPRKPRYLRTVRGVGYRYDPPD
jgi:DNA-binding response OmpR family regulator